MNYKIKFKELLYFVLILIVFMCAFGVTTEALMYPNQDLSATLIGNTILPAYFIIAGDDYRKDTIFGALNSGINSIV